MFRRGQWVVVGGKNIGVINLLGTADGDGGGIPVADVHLVDENGETIAQVVVQLADLAPVTVLEDIPAPRRAHLSADYDPVSGRSALAGALSESGHSARAQFKPARRKQ